MQTFLPFPNPVDSAECLDYRRLGKQRVEAFQILKVLHGESTGWKNHPAVKMWVGYEAYLAFYMNTMCQAWIARGYKDTLRGRYGFPKDIIAPTWLGDESFHRSHQSNLVRKFPEHYRQYFDAVPDDLPYVWPTGATS